MRVPFFFTGFFVLFAFVPALASDAWPEQLWYQAYLDCVKRSDPGCKQDPGSASYVIETAAADRHISEVNTAVNQYMEFKSDPDQYGVADYWVSGAKYGDCEDYALTKRARLIALGFPANALRMSVVRFDEMDDLHMVLLVYTSGHPSDPYVLDNEDEELRRLSKVLRINTYDFVSPYHATQDTEGIWRHGDGSKVPYTGAVAHVQ